jgi:outer membrane autotransporter protein
LSLLSSTALAQAQDATWLGLTGAPGNWHNPNNWAPEPSGPPPFVPTGTAFFNSSTSPTNAIDIGIGGVTTIGGLTFTGAPGYTFTVQSGSGFAISGAGIVADAASASPIFNLNNGGSVFFAGSATAGPSTINYSAGTLGFFQNSNAGTALITISGSNNFLNFQDGASAGSATIINNIGNFVHFNSFGGPLNATAGSSNIDNSGNVAFFNQSTAGSSTITTRSGANTFFINSSTAGASNQIVQSGGNLTFSNSSNAGTSTIDNAGGIGNGVRFNDASNAGSSHIINRANSLLLFNQSGVGASAANATIQNFGNLGFLANSTAANATIITEAGAQTSFQSTATGGTAAFVVNGAASTFGVLTLGGTDPSFTMGSLAGVSTGPQLGQVQAGTKNLFIGSNNQSTAYDGILATLGSLTKLGTGTLTLSGFAVQPGATQILDGGLHVTGQMTQTTSVLVDMPATLSGNGIIGNVGTTTTISGTLAPGNPGAVFQVMQLNGTVLFNPTATYRSTFENGGFSFVAVNGTATLNGTLNVRLNTTNVNFNSNYTLLTSAQPLVGQFQSNVLEIPATLTPTVSYNTNNVFISFAPNIGGAATGGNLNQQAAGAAIQTGLAGAGGPGGFLPLFGMSTPTFLATLSQLSGEIATASAPSGLKVMDSFLSVMLNPFLESRGGGFAPGPSLAFAADDMPDEALAYARKRKTANAATDAFARLRQPAAPPEDGRFNVWAAGYGGWGKTEGDTAVGSATVDSRFGGVAAGLDFRPASVLLFGVAIGGAKSSFGLAEGRGTGESDVAQLGAYGALRLGRAFLSAAFAYGWHSVSTDRTVANITTDPIKGSYSAHSLNTRAELGSRFGTPHVGLTPFAAVQYQSFHAPAYDERATGAAVPFALSFAANTTEALRSEVGVWFDASPAHELRLRARVAWAHNFTDTPMATGSFTSIPSGPFVVSGAKTGADSLLASAASEWRVQSGMALTSRFDADLSSKTTNYSASGGLRFNW